MGKNRAIARFIAGILAAVVLPLAFPPFSFAADTTVFSSGELKSRLYNELTDRTNAFTINYSGDDTSEVSKNMKVLLDSVFDGTDDYLRGNLMKWQCEYSGSGNTLALDFNVQYRTTASQEEYVDQRTDAILEEIIMPGMSDYEKLQAIHSFVCDHVAYDYTYTLYTAYAALAKGKAVCQGYALLMDKMLEKAGIRTIIMEGEMDGGPHAWNLVRLDDVWYHVDATNDDILDDRYFLKTDSFMQEEDFSWVKWKYPEADADFIEPLKIMIRVDGCEIFFDVPPYVNRDNRTMVPVRFVSESLGADVRWNDILQEVIIENGSDMIRIPINDKEIYHNGNLSLMDTQAVIKNGRTMVPVRFVSEYLGANVQWDPKQLIVDIYSEDYGALKD